MNLKRSLFFNYSAQLYLALINIIVIPFYIDRLGAEGYGLIGFYLVLQGWMQILDAGVGGSLTRQISVSKYHFSSYKIFLKQFYYILLAYVVIGGVVLLFGYLSKEYISTAWLTSTLDTSLVVNSVLAMFIILGFRFIAGPLRSGLIGLEKHPFISITSVFFATLKFPCSIIVLDYYGNSILHYFLYQSILSVIELLFFLSGFVFFSKKRLKNLENIRRSVVKSSTIKELLFFSGQLSLLSVLWVIVTQTDKIVLTKILDLTDFSYYSLSVSISGVILILSAPLTQILQPRLSALASQNKLQAYKKIYINSFSLLSAVAISIAVFLFFFDEQLIYIWSAESQ